MSEFDLASEMSKNLIKQASTNDPSNLAKAAECLHAALEIFEEAGMTKQADGILCVLQKFAIEESEKKHVQKLPSVQSLMEAGITQHDMRELSKGSPIAKAKFNLVLRRLHIPEHEIAKLVGPMTEHEAKMILDPNRSFGKIWEALQNPEPVEMIDFKSLQPAGKPSAEESLEFKSLAAKKQKAKQKGKAVPKKVDRHTKGLTTEKQIENLKDHGTQFNLAKDNACAIDVPPRKDVLTADDFDVEFADALGFPEFDIGASDDELDGSEADDELEVFDKELPLESFEDEKD